MWILPLGAFINDVTSLKGEGESVVKYIIAGTRFHCNNITFSWRLCELENIIISIFKNFCYRNQKEIIQRFYGKSSLPKGDITLKA